MAAFLLVSNDNKHRCQISLTTFLYSTIFLNIHLYIITGITKNKLAVDGILKLNLKRKSK